MKIIEFIVKQIIVVLVGGISFGAILIVAALSLELMDEPLTHANLSNIIIFIMWIMIAQLMFFKKGKK